MTDRDRLLAIWKRLDLPEGQAVLSGSGSLVMHGVERNRPLGDVDIFVATRTWFDMLDRAEIPREPCETCGDATVFRNDDGFWQECACAAEVASWLVWTTDPDDPDRRCDPPYLQGTMEDVEVNIFHGWRVREAANIDVNRHIREAVVVDGIPCVPLETMLAWKRQVDHPKHKFDIEAIERKLNLTPLDYEPLVKASD